jgi:magnesium chelatase subunit ChlI-like protein
MAKRHAGLLGNGGIRNRGDPICIAQLSRKEPFLGIFAPGVICLPTACFGPRPSLLTRMAGCMLGRRSVHHLRLLGPPGGHIEAGAAPRHHPAGDAPGGSAGDHPHPSRRWPDRWGHSPHHDAPVPGPAPYYCLHGPDRRRADAEAWGSVACHHAILLLDELPEVTYHVLEVLRQPLENGLTRIPPPACPRPCGTGRAGGSDANHHGLLGVLPRAADAFRLTGEHPRSTDEPSSTDKSGSRPRWGRPHA